jgi:hypothetical protein
VVILKFHPLSYLHIYVLGMLTAVLLLRWDEHHRYLQYVSLYGACAALIGLYLQFALMGSSSIPAAKLTYRLGAVAPLQCLLLVGLTLGVDPVARLLSQPVLQPLERLSFPQYVFQFIVFFGYERSVVGDPGYWICLAAIALLAFLLVQEPLKSRAAPRLLQARGVLGIVAVAGLVTLLAAVGRDELGRRGAPTQARSPASFEAPEQEAAPRPRAAADAGDALSGGPVEVLIGDQFLPFADAGSLVINPSVLYRDGVLVAAVREHAYSTRRRRVNATAVDTTVTWRSSVLLGILDPATYQLVAAPVRVLEETSWAACSRPPVALLAGGGTHQVLASGFEDPRLMDDGAGGLLLTTNLYYPTAAANTSVCYAVPRRMMAASVTVTRAATGGGELALFAASDPVLLMTPERDPASTEKNWLAFAREGSTFFVRSISPFVVVRLLNEEAAASPRRAETAFASVVAAASLAGLLAERNSEAHGGANPIELALNNATGDLQAPDASHGEGWRSVFVGIFHTVEASGAYKNFFFQFELLDGSWRLQRISRELRAHEAAVANGDSSVGRPMSFMSGLARTPDGVMVSYGSSNLEARLRLYPWALFNRLWVTR